MTEIEWNGKGKLTLSTGKRFTIILKREIDLIVYGNGYHFDFAIFAESLKKRILSANKDLTVDILECVTKKGFLDILLNFKTDHKIRNLHIFSHAFGAGLSLGYGTEGALNSRMALIDEFDNPQRPIPYEEILKSEVGILFVDDLLYEPYLGNKETIRKRFLSNSSCQIWGCNSGIADWVYINDNEETDYWEVLNTKNTPKGSISQELASYFNIPCKGANSGSHIEVKKDGKWITSTAYKEKYGKYPSGAIPHRLHPDEGEYEEFSP